MTFVVYPAILDDSENERNCYTVTFPNVKGAITQGYGEGEAMSKGSEVLGALLCNIPKNKLPLPSDIEQIKKENPTKIVVPIFSDLGRAARLSKTAVVRKNTTIPSYLAYLAEEEGINFSQTLTDALKEKLGIQD